MQWRINKFKQFFTFPIYVVYFEKSFSIHRQNIHNLKISGSSIPLKENRQFDYRHHQKVQYHGNKLAPNARGPEIILQVAKGESAARIGETS